MGSGAKRSSAGKCGAREQRRDMQLRRSCSMLQAVCHARGLGAVSAIHTPSHAPRRPGPPCTVLALWPGGSPVLHDAAVPLPAAAGRLLLWALLLHPCSCCCWWRRHGPRGGPCAGLGPCLPAGAAVRLRRSLLLRPLLLLLLPPGRSWVAMLAACCWQLQWRWCCGGVGCMWRLRVCGVGSSGRSHCGCSAPAAV
jgi:hypothetical protein